MNPAHPLTVRRLAAIQQALREQDLNLHEIADKVFMSWRWAREYVTYLHEEQKVIHIVNWICRKGGSHEYPVAVYRFGPGRDKKKPAAQTPREKAALLRKRRNADEDRRDVFLSRDRARKRKIKPDPLVGALFGRAP